ncbi:MAG TPA: DUF6279 family lipoprotein [Candidatus Binatia bacterium]|nr:DUF6279 family lipoprotein [Candidatus Binatia bacterium]
MAELARRLALLVPAALIATGCAATRLAYNNMDWVVGWQLNRYVDLEPPQKALFDERFQAFWAWHRSTQLKLYARDLRELAATAGEPLSPEQVSQYLMRSSEHGMRALREATPDMAAVLSSMSDEQVKDMLDKLAEQRLKRAKEESGLDADEIAEQARDQMIKNLKRWIGSLDKPQKQRVEAWSRQRHYSGTIWQQYAQDWNALFRAVLAHRGEPAFERELGELFAHPRLPHAKAMAEMAEYNRKVWVSLLADISASLSAGQRRHLQEKLRDLAGDFDALAAEKAAPGAHPAGAPPES